MQDYQHLYHGFPPVYDSNSNILILGSFPSVKSREQQFYYGHPQNRFWKVLAAVAADGVPHTTEEKGENIDSQAAEGLTEGIDLQVIAGVDGKADLQTVAGRTGTAVPQAVAGACRNFVPQTIAEKKEFLLRHRIALWDVIEECEIVGSSDSSIRNVVPVDIAVILRQAPIQKIFANGTKAFELYRKYLLPVTGIACEKLPSTSPANAAYSLERLTECWKKIWKRN